MASFIGHRLRKIHWIVMIRKRENRSSGFPTRSDTNRPVQSQKKARRL